MEKGMEILNYGREESEMKQGGGSGILGEGEGIWGGDLGGIPSKLLTVSTVSDCSPA